MNKKYKHFLKLNFYEIYWKSFFDSNNDGYGDCVGIIKKIPYLKGLGIKGVWITPCFKSPNVDSGYDISDYYNLDEKFGTLDQFKTLITALHKNGIKVLIDLVVNHTSNLHNWFIEAKKTKDNPYHDFYYWFDKPINNWKSCFGGSAWEYVPTVNQYYLHSFAIEQPDLNWTNPKVRKEVKKIIDYWIDFGIDGFRCDVLDMIAKDFKKGLNRNGVNLHKYIREIFGDKKASKLFTVGECWGANKKNISDLTSASRKELTTSFLGGNIVNNNGVRFNIQNTLDYDTIHRYFSLYQKMCCKKNLIFVPFIENHDQSRCVSRFGDVKNLKYESATFFATLLFTLKGTPFLLQGQEFGTPNANYDDISSFNDIETINFYKVNKNSYSSKDLMWKINMDSRDNGRRPMMWDSSINSGFNKGTKPWLPINKEYLKNNVELDIKSNKSIYKYYKKVIKLKQHKVLTYGNFVDLTLDRKDLFVYKRVYKNDEMIIVCNYNKPSLFKTKTKTKLLLSNYKNKTDILKPFECRILSVIK